MCAQAPLPRGRPRGRTFLMSTSLAVASTTSSAEESPRLDTFSATFASRSRRPMSAISGSICFTCFATRDNRVKEWG